METTEIPEIEVAIQTPSTQDLIKEAALKAVVSTIISVAVGALAEALVKRAVKKRLDAAKSKRTEVIDTTATES